MDIKWLMNICIIIWLLLCALQDIRSKKISVKIITAGFFIITICSLFSGGLWWKDRIAGLTPGALMLFLNLITRGQVGLGDGIILSILGLSLGFTVTWGIFILALTGAAILSLVLIVFKKAGRKTSIPFIPFLLTGVLGMFIL